jgi:hypothetical protein
LRCLAYRDGDSYITECIDLNLLVKRRSISEAASGLEDAIKGYMLTALENEASFGELVETGEIKGLLPRPSPLAHRMRYHWYCLLAAMVFGSRRSFQLHDYNGSHFATC